MRKGRKYTLIVFAGLILLATIILLVTQTSYFRDLVKKKLITVVEKQLNATIEIEALEGNFYSNLTVKNLFISQNDSIVALFPSVYLQYDLWDLTGQIISIDSVIIDQPQINLWQQKDSSWNVSSLVKKKNTPKTKKPFNFEIQAKYLAIKKGSVSIASFSKIIPRQTNNFNLQVNGSYSKLETKVNLKKFSFATQNPSLLLNNLSGIYTMNKNGIQLDSLLLVTGGSTIDFNGHYESKENANSSLDASKVDKNELAIFIPTFKLLCSPAVKATFSSKNDSVLALAELQYNNQSIKANVSFSTLNNLLSKSGTVPYSADLNFKNFRIENWIETNDLRALIDGQVELSGANLLKLNSNMSISANLENSQYEEIVFDTLAFNGIYNNDSLSAKLDVRSDFGKVQITGILDDITETPSYKARIQSTDFNLTAFVPKMRGTKVNGIIQAEGVGLDTRSIIAQAELDLNHSSVYQLPINSLHANVSLNKMDLIIDSLQLEVPGANASGSVNLNLDSLFLETLVNAQITSTKVLDSLVVLPIQFDSVTTTTSISGPVQTLEIGGDVDIYNYSGYNVETKRASGNYLVSVKKDSVNVWVNTIASAVQTGPIIWDTAVVDFNYINSDVIVEANVIWKDTINANLITNITIGDTMLFEVPKFEAKTLLSAYYLPDTLRARFIQNKKIEIEKFSIKDNNQKGFILSANGAVSSSDTNRLEIEVNQFNLVQLNRIFHIPDSIKGLLEADIFISGTSQNPSVEGTVEIENPLYGKYSLSSLNSNFEYTDQNGFAEVTTSDLGKSVYANFSAPFTSYADSLDFFYAPPDSFNASIIIDSLEVSRFAKQLIQSDSISGIINGTIEAKGDFSNPQFFGKLDYTDGHFVNKSLGIDYNHIHTSVVFDGNQINMDTILIQQEEGLMSLSGKIDFDSTLIKGNIKSSSLQLVADNFFVTQHRNYELLIDANSFIVTDEQNPEFGGKVKVIRSDIFLPAIIPDKKTDIEKDVPLLLQALQTSQDSVLSNANSTGINSNFEFTESAFYNNLTGRLNVEIPRNTWVKNDDMRLELSGDLEIVKTGSYFEIFGNIDVIRGQYILYGKKLNIKESQIVFQGGEELDPTLSIVAEYIYRSSDKEKRYLELIITGELSEPEITFLLDDAEITETDGISVLIFGATSDEIGYSGQNGAVGSMGSSAVTSVLTSQLNKTVGAQFDLDMIEITSTENWQSAAFVVGKYITNDIFITYQRGFGEEEDDEITPEIITAEYEINDKLFLRIESGNSKTSGLDIVLKFEQKKEKIVPTKKPSE